MKTYHVYFMSSQSTVLYIGVTNNIVRRVWEHKSGIIPGFSQRYNCKQLVYFEEYNDIDDAINREKQLKKWSRKKKERLIETINPNWNDLSKEF